MSVVFVSKHTLLLLRRGVRRMLSACHVCRAVAHSIMSFCNGDFVHVLSVHLWCVSVVRAIVDSFGQVSIAVAIR